MPMMQKGIAAFSDHMPKVISPKVHAMADYATLGGFLIMSALFWKRHRRAAIGSMACAAAEAANILLTDYPGGVSDIASFQTHGRIDVGLAAISSALPNFMEFSRQPEAKFFRVMGLSITSVGALTDFSSRRQRKPFLWKSA